MFIPKFETVLDPVALDFVGVQQQQMLIDGQFVDGVGGKFFPTSDPASARKITAVPLSDARDVDLAVVAANRALEDHSWSRMLPSDRQKLLLDLADLIEAHGETIANLEIRAIIS